MTARQETGLILVKLFALLAACAWVFTPGAWAEMAPPRGIDLQSFITEKARSGAKRIVIPAGRYRVAPKMRQHLVLSGLKDIVIDASGVEMICTETTRALTIRNCENLKIIGLIIDYDPLPFTQGRIVRISPDKRSHEIELFDGYPGAETALLTNYQIYDPTSRTLRHRDYPLDSVTPLGPSRLLVTKKRPAAQDPEEVGDIVVINSEHAPNGSIPHAVLLEKSRQVTLEEVTLYASNCFGFLELDCNRNTYLRCRVAPRPSEGDLADREDPRIRSLNADAFHSKHARRGPAYIDCEAHFMGDDAINICGNYHFITHASGDTLRVLARDSFFDIHETVELFSYTGERLPDAKVLEITSDGSITPEEREFLVTQRMDETIRIRWAPKAYKVRLDRAVELPRGSLIASRERMGYGFKVVGGKFGMNRSRGILVKGSEGVIANNLVVGTRSEAIKVEAEYWWLESGSSDNVTIEGNEIRNCLGIAIGIYSFGGRENISPAGAHHNINIRNNKITHSPQPCLVVTSTRRLEVTGNSLSDFAPGKPYRLRGSIDKLLRGHPHPVPPILIIACESAAVDGDALTLSRESLP